MVAAARNLDPRRSFGSLAGSRPRNLGHWNGCRCATRLPKSRTSFNFLNMKFELEEQEHHLSSCKLFGTKKGMKRTVKATLPVRLAWLSARMTVVCFEYTSGTSRPGLAIRCRNIVPNLQSPVKKLCDSFSLGVRRGCTTKEFIHGLQLLEREIFIIYSHNQASPWDVDEWGFTHAEVKLIISMIPYIADRW